MAAVAVVGIVVFILSFINVHRLIIRVIKMMCETQRNVINIETYAGNNNKKRNHLYNIACTSILLILPVGTYIYFVRYRNVVHTFQLSV